MQNDNVLKMNNIEKLIKSKKDAKIYYKIPISMCIFPKITKF